MTRVLSADWVLPVEGEPIEDGAVAIGDDGRIAAVGPASELGRGEHYAGAAIVPGFVNAHTHLEYAVYAAFGDGLSFAPWLATHIERKARIDRDDMEAIARLGAAECLASGVTTVGDASFAGAAAHACAELGLRAIVYLEVFGRDPEHARAQYEEKLEYVRPVLSELVAAGVSPHAPYTCTTEVYELCRSLGVPVMTHFNESSDELDWLLRGEGPMRPVADLLVDPDGQTGIRRLAAAGVLDERVVAAHCVKVDAEEIALAGGARRRRRALPALERLPRLRHRAARRVCWRRASASESARTASPRSPRTTTSRSSGPSSRPRGPARSGLMRSRRRPRSSSRRSAARERSGWRTRSAPSFPASRPISP